ncbi:MAG: hypothetical protein ACREIV_16780, partial [Planctomycetaceae bacterium]
LIHCQNCRALLNPDLERDSVEIPEFVPLPEIVAMVEASPQGYYVACPQCRKELRIHRKYVGRNVRCKFCGHAYGLELDAARPPSAFFTACPHCSEELRANWKYMGQKVVCKFCGGSIHFVEGAE